jgi:hypothetical protein
VQRARCQPKACLAWPWGSILPLRKAAFLAPSWDVQARLWWTRQHAQYAHSHTEAQAQLVSTSEALPRACADVDKPLEDPALGQDITR